MTRYGRQILKCNREKPPRTRVRQPGVAILQNRLDEGHSIVRRLVTCVRGQQQARCNQQSHSRQKRGRIYIYLIVRISWACDE